MPTIIRTELPDGTIISRCNQHCYNGHLRDPKCLCGGKNFGVGLSAAKANLPEIIADLVRAHKGPGPLLIRVAPGKVPVFQIPVKKRTT